mmetsp:Transcript_13546/g.29763  ORF Transcript_13546/g.29763 Transcript_13546/m.29763 type:complete len:119 (-) Transcript_13546:740-1096(-)
MCHPTGSRKAAPLLPILGIITEIFIATNPTIYRRVNFNAWKEKIVVTMLSKLSILLRKTLRQTTWTLVSLLEPFLTCVKIRPKSLVLHESSLLSCGQLVRYGMRQRRLFVASTTVIIS